MSAEYTYDYSIVRVVPRVDRGEQVNVGVILSCADTDFLDARIEVRLLRTVLLWVGAIAGANIVLQMVTGGPALYGLLAVGGDFGFSVYRPQGAFNHPLFAGAFLTIPATMGIGQWLTTGRIKPLVLGLLSAAGIVSTVSRSSILAVGIALGIGAVVAPFFLGWVNLKRWFVLLGLGVVGAVVVLNFGPLIERSESIESQLSAGVRERIQGRLADLDPKKIFVSATHTHTAPVLRPDVYRIPKDGVMQPTEYGDFLIDRLVDAVTTAWEGRRPGRAGTPGAGGRGAGTTARIPVVGRVVGHTRRCAG